MHQKTILVVGTGTKKKLNVFQKLKELDSKVVCLNSSKNWADSYVDKWIIEPELESMKSAPEIDCHFDGCLLYTSPSPRDATLSRMPSSA